MALEPLDDAPDGLGSELERGDGTRSSAAWISFDELEVRGQRIGRKP